MRRMWWCLIIRVCGDRGITRRRSSGDMHAAISVFAMRIAQQSINFSPFIHSFIHSLTHSLVHSNDQSSHPAPCFIQQYSIHSFYLYLLVCSRRMLARLSTRICSISFTSIRTTRCFSESSRWKDSSLTCSSACRKNYPRGWRHPVYWRWCQSGANFTHFVEIRDTDQMYNLEKASNE